MAKMTIAQLREKAIEKLAARKTDNPTEQDYQDARRVMNSYYRLCGLEENLLSLQNDPNTCDKWYTAEKEAKREKWYKRLNAIFETEYNAQLVYFGYFPTICEKGTTQSLYLEHFYN